MKYRFGKIGFLCILLVSSRYVQAQDSWSSPEAEQIYKHAREYMMSGNLKDAIITFKQTIVLEPDKMIVYRDLGKCYYLNKNFSEAEEILTPVLKSPQADEQTYETMAECYAADGDKKSAEEILKKGLIKFPASGILFHQAGKMREDDKEQGEALKSWLQGIRKDPAYHLNYYEAARTYMGTDKVEWGLVYGEIFVNMEHETQRSDEMRKMLLDGYKTMFDNITPDEVPQFGKPKPVKPPKNFEEAVQSVYVQLTPVVSDGITTENLTMVRARFLMDWFTKYAQQYPFTLFSCQDMLMKNGYFDVYNEWLFGKAENPQQYEAWNKFHPGDMEKFQAWIGSHPLKPVASDFYNKNNVDDLFTKKKKLMDIIKRK